MELLSEVFHDFTSVVHSMATVLGVIGLIALMISCPYSLALVLLMVLA